MSSIATDPAMILRRAEHRPWPLPEAPWLMFQSWQRLLFLHWPVSIDQVRPHVPDSLLIDEHDGRAWLGITPFRLCGLRVRGLPAVPGAADFLELNVRTYVRAGEAGGVFFFSLDAHLAAAAGHSAVVTQRLRPARRRDAWRRRPPTFARARASLAR